MSSTEEKKSDLPESKVIENQLPAATEAVATSGEVTEKVPVVVEGKDAAASAVEGDKSLPPWREKAGEIINQSSIKIKEAATVAGTAVVGAAGVTGTKVKATWESTKEGWQTNVQPRVTATWQSTKDGWQSTVKPKVDAAARVAVEAGVIIKKSILETKEKVASAALHKKIAEATKNSLMRSRTFLVKMEILPPELNPRAVFGVPFEKVVGYQAPDRPVPHIVVSCVQFIESQGLSTEFLFDDEGDPTLVTRLMKTYERDDQASIPAGVRPQDAAQVLLAFFRCLPEPILTFQLYDDIIAIKEEEDYVPQLQKVLGQLPVANRETLQRVFALLSKVAKEEASGKMNASSLAREWAPVLLWKKGGAPATVSPGVAPEPLHQNPVAGGSAEPADAPNEPGEKAEKPSEEVSVPVKDKQRAIAKAVEAIISHFDAVFKSEA